MGTKRLNFKTMKWGVPPHVVDERDLRLTFNANRIPIINAAFGSRAGSVELFPMAPASLPGKKDYSDEMPLVEDQAQTLKCTAFALSAMISRFLYRDLKKQGKTPRKEDFCEDWIYDNARALAGYNLGVSGLHPRDALELARQKGILPQREWDSLKSRPKKKGEALVEILKNYQIQLYSGVNQGNLADVKQALVTFGPLLAAIFVYPEWEICDGVMQMPAPNQAAIGRHSIVIVGYNDVTGRLKIRNSWGNSWGADGYAVMPYDVLQRCCFSLWSAIDLLGSKDLYPLNAWEKSVSKWPQWFKDAFGIPL